MLPGISGDELCRDLRSFSDVPIMMLTALGQVDDRIEGFEFGVDDYLAKPFSLRELLLRVGALVRRSQVVQASVGEVRAGVFVIDPLRRRVWVRQEEVPSPRASTTCCTSWCATRAPARARRDPP